VVEEWMVVVEYSGDGARGHEIVVFEKIENFEIFVKFLEVKL